jgi:hypothetical protein
MDEKNQPNVFIDSVYHVDGCKKISQIDECLNCIEKIQTNYIRIADYWIINGVIDFTKLDEIKNILNFIDFDKVNEIKEIVKLDTFVKVDGIKNRPSINIVEFNKSNCVSCEAFYDFVTLIVPQLIDGLNQLIIENNVLQ